METENLNERLKQRMQFKSGWKGTCVLCLNSIHYGEMVVEMEDERGFHRFVHEDCNRNLVLSSPDSLATEYLNQTT